MRAQTIHLRPILAELVGGKVTEEVKDRWERALGSPKNSLLHVPLMRMETWAEPGCARLTRAITYCLFCIT
jgi:hypothetical protein